MKNKPHTNLIDRLMANDARAQRELIKKFNSRIFMYFRLRIKGEGNYEDLVQEVFASFFEAIKKNKVTEDQFIAPFIFGIAKRVMYNFFYKKKRDENIQKKGEEEFEISYDFEEDERLANEKMNQIIQNVIDKKLAEVDKIILREFYLRENDVGEVAELIGKTKHYVSVRKERALKKIKNEILTKKLYI
ncbi:MAG: sigma-70 family RNA polymerase sigma factor [Candidatus Aminicenantes bacterium]|nr:MAG: sigma-70 family RNA polymerase sigma factor [Candidatus Aminicenantes bacterium]